VGQKPQNLLSLLELARGIEPPTGSLQIQVQLELPLSDIPVTPAISEKDGRDQAL
jgi:hypothetical protein